MISNKKPSTTLTTVLVTGVFDLLHIEHIRFLQKAKAQGDQLIVAIESDVRVKHIKGHERPINNQAVRQEQLEALKCVDKVIILPQKFHTQEAWINFMRHVSPDIYAVSSNSSYSDNKQKICEQLGIKFAIVHHFNPDYSSTQILQKLVDHP